MWFNSLMGKIRTAGPEMKTGYLAGASLQAHCVDAKLIACSTLRSGESARLSLVGRRRAEGKGGSAGNSVSAAYCFPEPVLV